MAERTQRKEEIAEALGVDWRTVTRWAQSGCPHTKQGRHPYLFSLQEVEAWINTQGRTTRPGRPAEHGGLSEAQKKANLQWTVERALKARIERQTMEAKVHDVAKCMARRLGQIHAVKGELLALPRSVAPELVGLDRDEMEKILLERVEAMLNRFASGQ